jgi:hypothetical protein
MEPRIIEAACNEACRDIEQLVRSRKESGQPLLASELLSAGLQRLLGYGVRDVDWWDCEDFLQRRAQDLRFQRLLVDGASACH